LPAQVQRLADNVKDKTAATKNAFPALRTGLQALKGTAQETKGATNRLVAGEGEGQKGLEGYLQRLDESLRRELQAHRQSSRESFKLILTNVDDPVKASKDVMKTVSSVDAECGRKLREAFLLSQPDQAFCGLQPHERRIRGFDSSFQRVFVATTG
jgi:hypothetical protein